MCQALSASQMLSSLSSEQTFLHFTDEEIEAQRGRASSPSHRATQAQTGFEFRFAWHQSTAVSIRCYSLSLRRFTGTRFHYDENVK